MARRFTWSGWLLVGAGLVGACNPDRPNVGLDQDPPEITVSSQVPLYSQAKSLSLDVNARDIMGTKQVWCAVNNGSAISAARTGSAPTTWKEGTNWTCSAALAENAPNVIAIWAEDYGGHSGVSGKPPYMQVLTVVQDDTALAVGLNGAAQATYYDETKMTVGTATPPVYDRNGVGFEVVRPGETVHKASTRLASRTLTTSPADLEDKNPDNLPWLQFAVSLSGSPLASATYKIDATAEGATKTYSGDLMAWRSPQSSASATSSDVYLDLPLDSVRIPLLESAVGPVALKVAVEVTDVAGNKGGDEVDLKYAVIGPPLNVAIDSEYPKAGAPKSTHPYLIANGTGPYGYGTLFNAGDVTTFGPEQQVRLARLVVTNPAPEPVALDVSSIMGSWKITEAWTGKQSGVIGSATFNDQTCPGNRQDAADHLAMYAPLGGLDEGARSPDPGVTSAGWNGVAATSDLSNVVELRNGSAAQKVGTRYIVPAADGSAPGVVYLYVTRPLTVSRAEAPALDHHDQIVAYTNDVGTLYIYANDIDSPSGCCAQGYRWTTYYLFHTHIPQGDLSWDSCSLSITPVDPRATQTGFRNYCEPGPVSCPYKYWLGTSSGAGTPCTNCTRTCSCSQWAQVQVYNKYTYYRQLSAAAATETVTGAFAPVTQPTDVAGTVYGVPNAGATSIQISGDFTH